MGTTEEKSTVEEKELWQRTMTPAEQRVLSKFLASRYHKGKKGGDYYAVPIIALLVIVCIAAGPVGVLLGPVTWMVIGTIQLGVGLLWRKKLGELQKEFRVSYVVSVILFILFGALTVIIAMLVTDLISESVLPPSWLYFGLMVVAGVLAVVRIRLYQTAMIKTTYRFSREASAKWADYREKCSALIGLVVLVVVATICALELQFASLRKMKADGPLEVILVILSASIMSAFWVLNAIGVVALTFLLFNVFTRKMETAAAEMTLQLLEEAANADAEAKEEPKAGTFFAEDVSEDDLK